MMTHRSVRDIYEEVAEMQYLKRSVATDVRAKADRSVRDIVEKTLADIEDRGDAAVRELSIKFDGWDRESYALKPGEKQDCPDQLSGQDLKDIELAQEQVRNVAQIKRYSIKNVAVETLQGEEGRETGREKMWR